MNPHDLPPLVVTPKTPDVHSDRWGGAVIDRLGVEDLLAEPPEKDGEWPAAMVRRLLASSTQPVAANVTGDLGARLTAAGWPNVAPDASTTDARDAFWPAFAECKRLRLGYGSLAPKLVLVGERVNFAGQLPFASRGGHWLFVGLRRLGWDELTCYLTNAYSVHREPRVAELQELAAAFASYDPTWIALGRAAEKTLRTAKLDPIFVPHPMHKRRFAYSEDYAAEMRTRGVPEGQWIGQALPAHPVDRLPELPAPYDILSVAFRPGATRRAETQLGTRDRKLAVEVAEHARTIYITAPKRLTFVELAKKTGVHRDRLREVSRDENWPHQREEHIRAKAAAILEADIQAEAKTIRDIRLKSLTTALTILERLGDKDPDRLSAREVEILVALNRTLAGSIDGTAIEEADPFAGFDLAQLLDEIGIEDHADLEETPDSV